MAKVFDPAGVEQFSHFNVEFTDSDGKTRKLWGMRPVGKKRWEEELVKLAKEEKAARVEEMARILAEHDDKEGFLKSLGDNGLSLAEMTDSEPQYASALSHKIPTLPILKT